LHGRAWVFERMSNFPEAEADLRRIVELNPKDERAKIRLAGVFYATDRRDEALKLYEEVRPAHQGDPRVIVGIARCKKDLNKATEAARILDDFLKKTPDDVEALTERGKIALEAGKVALGEKLLRRAVKLSPFDRQSNHALYL